MVRRQDATEIGDGVRNRFCQFFIQNGAALVDVLWCPSIPLRIRLELSCLVVAVIRIYGV